MEHIPHVYKPWSEDPARTERKVVLTGIGAATPLGNDFPTSWRNLVDGKTGLTNYEMPETECEISVIGRVNMNSAQIIDKLKSQFIQELYPKFPQEIRSGVMHRSVQLDMVSASEALIDGQMFKLGKINKDVDPKRIGIYSGCVIAGASEIGEDEQEVFRKGRADARSIMKIDPHTLTTVPSRIFGFKGPLVTIAAACSAGANAIIAGAESIAKGDCDMALVIGADSFVMRPIMVKYFEALAGALSKENDPRYAVRSYNHFATGTVVAEGACALLLETEQSAKRRGVPILAEWAGYGEAGEAHHPTNPSGEGTFDTIDITLQKSGIPADGYIYVNGHGGGTYFDREELNIGILPPFENRGIKNRLVVNSTKAATGHMWGGTGTFESAVAIQAMRDSVIPPLLNSDSPLRYDVEMARNKALHINIELAINTNTGLGGGTATDAFKKYR